jgi:uncharacterized protein YoxC
MNMEILLIIFGIAIVVLLIFCIPILIQIWRAARDIAVTLETLNQSLPAILKNMEEITGNINRSIAAVDREVQSLSGTIGRFQVIISDIVDDIQHISPVIMKLPLFQGIKNAVAITRGIRVFLDVFLAKE